MAQLISLLIYLGVILSTDSDSFTNQQLENMYNDHYTNLIAEDPELDEILDWDTAD